MTSPLGTDPSPRPPLVSLSIDWSQLPRTAVAVGVSLVSAAVVLSGFYSRKDEDLDLSNFTMGVLATLGLLGIAVVAGLRAPSTEHRGALVSWPGATGAVGAGMMLGVLIDDDPASTYVGAVAVIALSIGGYLVARGAPFVVSLIVGAAVLYGQAFDDLVDTGGNGDNTFMVIGAGILVFVLAVTAAGWLLPATRVLSSVIVGAGGLVGYVALLVALFVTRSFTTAFAAGSGDDTPGIELGAGAHDPFRNDVYVVLVYCAVLAVLWVGCALVTGHVGFRILVLAAAAVIIPAASVAVFARHPTWWEVVTCALGAAALVGGASLSKPAS